MYAKTTYYAELKSIQDISSPIIGNNVGMRHKGIFSSDWQDEDIFFDSPFFGLSKGQQDNGLIYCQNSSNLFSFARGQIDIEFRLTQDVENGILAELNGSTRQLSSFLIWGVNVGQYDSILPSISSSFTKDGITFSVWTTASQFSIVDSISNINAGETVFMRFAWDKDGIDDFGVNDKITMYYNCNGQEIVSNAPISQDSMSGLNFCVGNTPFLNSNLPISIGKIIVYDSVYEGAQEEWFSSSSSIDSSSSSSLDSSSSSIDSPSSSSSSSS